MAEVVVCSNVLFEAFLRGFTVIAVNEATPVGLHETPARVNYRAVGPDVPKVAFFDIVAQPLLAAETVAALRIGKAIAVKALWAHQ
jgi:hypothetical protein